MTRGELVAMVHEAERDEALAYAEQHPERTDAVAVRQLAKQLAGARLMEDEVGAAPMISTARARLETVTELAQPSAVRLGLSSSRRVHSGAQWAGWLHLAVGRFGQAGAWLDRALEWAAEVDDREMVATALSFRGHRAWLMGGIGPMIGLTEAALRDPAIYVGQRAYDQYQLARGHAAAGEHRDAVEALAAGADLAAESVEDDSGPRPPWHYYRGKAFFDLEHGLVRALLGDYCQAEELIGSGLARLPREMRDAAWTQMYREAVRTSIGGH